MEITYIKNPKCFYARLKSNEDKFKQLQKFMKKYDEIDGIVPKDVHEGMYATICCQNLLSSWSEKLSFL